MRTVAALAGFVLIGLSPSFIDWQQADEQQRGEIVSYYIVALGLLYVGLLRES